MGGELRGPGIEEVKTSEVWTGRPLPSVFQGSAAECGKWGCPDPPDPAGPGKIVDQRGTTTGKAAEEQIGQTFDAASVNGINPFEKMLANVPRPCDKMGPSPRRGTATTATGPTPA
ncbi:unnamed protein product [Prorocentrum cordatum]|uniref:Uncharacterized protein n=1 Tax=Prorocentrum cordatum TaxID=2364126 RepID=A0ABN9WZI7_9DINO|nr:unnamed protein product [Polarella glacialis]